MRGFCMKELFHIFKWNYKRFFSNRKETEWLEEHYSENHSYCTNAISSILKKHGKRWLLPVNITLFLLGLLFLIAGDFLQACTQSFWLSFSSIVVACIFMILKFDAWKVQEDKSILKLMYIGGMNFFGGYASITYIFLIIYENIVAYSAWGGN